MVDIQEQCCVEKNCLVSDGSLFVSSVRVFRKVLYRLAVLCYAFNKILFLEYIPFGYLEGLICKGSKIPDSSTSEPTSPSPTACASQPENQW